MFRDLYKTCFMCKLSVEQELVVLIQDQHILILNIKVKVA